MPLRNTRRMSFRPTCQYPYGARRRLVAHLYDEVGTAAVGDDDSDGADPVLDQSAGSLSTGAFPNYFEIYKLIFSTNSAEFRNKGSMIYLKPIVPKKDLDCASCVGVQSGRHNDPFYTILPLAKI